MSRTLVTVDVEGDHGTDELQGIDEWLPWLLDRFDHHGVRAVFFVVGDVGLRRPKSVREMSSRGHIIGSHGMTHRPLSSLAESEVRTELVESKAILEDLSAAQCEGFRAPYFDAPQHLEAMLYDCGYRWSSSRAPWSPIGGGGMATVPATADIHCHPVSRLMGLPLPDGLSWRRQFWPLSRWAPAPPVFYLHPYELLDTIGGFGHPRHWRILMARRNGARARSYLDELLSRWSSLGVDLSPSVGHGVEDDLVQR